MTKRSGFLLGARKLFTRELLNFRRVLLYLTWIVIFVDALCGFITIGYGPFISKTGVV